MDDYGSITIDNKNLLEDLLNLNKDQQERRINYNNFDYLTPSVGQKVYLESPTFQKEEDDLYRFVNSRIDQELPSARNNLLDSLDQNENETK
jgi:hypothetical protein